MKFDEVEGPLLYAAVEEEGEEVALGGSDFRLVSKNEDIPPPIVLIVLVRSPRSNDPTPPMDDDPTDELVRGDSTDVPPRGGDVILLVDCDDPLGGDITLVGGVTEE